MLNISFFITSFFSVFWLFYSLKFIDFTKILNQLDTSLLCQALVIMFLPLLTIWCIFGIIKNYTTNQNYINYLNKAMGFLRQSVEKDKSINETLSSTKKELSKIFSFNEFNTLIADANEILADIIKRSNSISSAQLEHLWTRTAGGERWLIAKTFIEICDFQTEFQKHLASKAQKDTLLKGSILEFYTHMLNLKQITENSQNQTLYNLLEYGAMSKVFSIITPLAKKLYAEVNSPQEEVIYQTKPKDIPTSSDDNKESFPSFLTSQTPSTNAREDNKETHIQNGLRAIREELTKTSSPIEKEPGFNSFSQTTSALRSFRQEPTLNTNPTKNKIISLEELEQEINASPENNYDADIYPFGAWENEKVSK